MFQVVEGAPNPYAWCREAVAAAVARRRLLRHLVRHWFGDRLRVPRTLGWGWNADERAWEIRSELVRGRHVPLRSPFGGRALVEDLVRDVMRPLQRRLAEAGFDGLVWQAGLGNPVAASNFLLEADGGPGPRWAWVDLESGVPALFALSPGAQVRFYLPRALRHRRPLFDDVHLPTLRAWLGRHREALRRGLGADAFTEILQETDRLEGHQQRWKALGRLHRGLLSEWMAGRLGRARAAWFLRRPLRWTAHWLATGTVRAARALVSAAGRLLGRLRVVPWGRLALGAARFAVSQRYRAHLARRHVSSRVRLLRGRGSLGAEEARRLRSLVRRDAAGEYLTDFGVHLMVKPLVKAMQWWVLPLLLLLGVVHGAVVAVVFVGGGAFVRTLYTSWRVVQCTLRGQPKPWVALAVGAVPVVGNAAFPVEILVSGVAESRHLARFVLSDTLAAIGRRLPVWGGRDTLTEHWFHDLPDRLALWLPRGGTPAPPAASGS